ncbi:hypothetical protein IRT45_34460 [Nocardia sp. BSTN01]|uniref:hypothetical protein n=1 Tax=Nocardia sp. BSTN01 TaxID=2783665 RepID=UPI00189076CF|nr:hypothetical protein [Nocardia sp. BSTN01]MBF5002222.1 hypothetical protein [Nocardia sp. BSTN01]
MLATWTDDNGVTHTGSADGRAYRQHRAKHPETAEPAKPVEFATGGTVEPAPAPADGEAFIPLASSEPASAAGEPVGDPAAAAEPRKRSR